MQRADVILVVAPSGKGQSMPSEKRFLCRTNTTFSPSGALDEDAFRYHLRRLVDAGIGVLLGSTGSGEGASLTPDELDRVYHIGVEVCRGKVPVYSNQPEEFTAARSIAQARRAIAAGVEALNIYGPNGLHGYAPTATEYLTLEA
jgi:4-hydroxy-tetrahydrodipicolinate synthase